MDAQVRELVRGRAGGECEYCRLKQENLPFAIFHVEHIIPRKHGGSDDVANLALACERCNSYKGPNLTGLDPATGEIVVLFNPRQNRWEEHFRQVDVTIIGLTPIGRATVRVLNMNEAGRLRLRTVLKRYGRP